MSNKEEYYIKPKEFKASLQLYYDTDNLTDDLAENIKKIAYGLSYNSSFINYTYKDDMIGDALIKMYSALKHKKYRFETGSNPFSILQQLHITHLLIVLKRKRNIMKQFATIKNKFMKIIWLIQTTHMVIYM